MMVAAPPMYCKLLQFSSICLLNFFSSSSSCQVCDDRTAQTIAQDITRYVQLLSAKSCIVQEGQAVTPSDGFKILGQKDTCIHCWKRIKSNYIAISHVWGKTTDYEFLGIDWKVPLSHPMKLAVIVDTLIREGKEFMWMDVLCIRQNDNSDKSAQVTRMGPIYNDAAECAVFMEDQDHASLALLEGYLGVGKTKLSSIIEAARKEKDARGAYRKFITGVAGFQLAALGCSDYFSRVWTLQELVLPKVLKLYGCRNWNAPQFRSVDFDRLMKLATWLTENVTGLKLANNVKTLLKVTNTRHVYQSVKGQLNTEAHNAALSECLVASGDRACFREEDHFFGTLGLAMGKLDVQVDYGVGVQEAGRRFYKACTKAGVNDWITYLHDIQEECTMLPSKEVRAILVQPFTLQAGVEFDDSCPETVSLKTVCVPCPFVDYDRCQGDLFSDELKRTSDDVWAKMWLLMVGAKVSIDHLSKCKLQTIKDFAIWIRATKAVQKSQGQSDLAYLTNVVFNRPSSLISVSRMLYRGDWSLLGGFFMTNAVISSSVERLRESVTHGWTKEYRDLLAAWAKVINPQTTLPLGELPVDEFGSLDVPQRQYFEFLKKVKVVIKNATSVALTIGIPGTSDTVLVAPNSNFEFDCSGPLTLVATDSAKGHLVDIFEVNGNQKWQELWSIQSSGPYTGSKITVTNTTKTSLRILADRSNAKLNPEIVLEMLQPGESATIIQEPSTILQASNGDTFKVPTKSAEWIIKSSKWDCFCYFLWKGEQVAWSSCLPTSSMQMACLATKIVDSFSIQMWALLETQNGKTKKVGWALTLDTKVSGERKGVKIH